MPFAYFWQAPASHLPLVPHEPLPCRRTGPPDRRCPCTFVQVPSSPGSEHDWQAPAQAWSQQTPCAQKVEAHSLPVEHTAPCPFGPHEFPVQTLGARQFVLVVQAPKHDAPLQT